MYLEQQTSPFTLYLVELRTVLNQFNLNSNSSTAAQSRKSGKGYLFLLISIELSGATRARVEVLLKFATTTADRRDSFNATD